MRERWRSHAIGSSRMPKHAFDYCLHLHHAMLRFSKIRGPYLMRRPRELSVTLWVTRRTTNIINDTLHGQSLPNAHLFTGWRPAGRPEPTVWFILELFWVAKGTKEIEMKKVIGVGRNFASRNNMHTKSKCRIPSPPSQC